MSELEYDIVSALDELEISKTGRCREVVYGRQVAFNILRKQGYTLQKIGSFFQGKIHHTTVLHGLNQYILNKHYADFRVISATVHAKLLPVFDAKIPVDIWQDYAICLVQMENNFKNLRV